MDLAKLLVTIAVDNADANKAFDETGEKGEKAKGKLSKAFGAMGKGAVAFGKLAVKGMAVAGGGIMALTAKSIQSYADYEQLVGGIETLFKGSADKVKGYADVAYQTAGMSANEYMETVTGFSASLLQSLGNDTEAAADKANMALIDMSDNANKMGSDMESIKNAYSGFAKQNYTMLDNLKLGYGGTKEEMERLLKDAEKFSGIKYDISSYADVVDAIHVVQTEMGITGTTAKEASTTISGSMTQMKASWENLLTAMSQGDGWDMGVYVSNFVDTVSTAVNNLLPVVSSALDGVVLLIQQIAPLLIAEIPGILSSLLPSVISAATSLINAIVEIIPDLVQAIVAAIPAFIDGFVQIFNAVVQALPTIMQSLIQALPTLIPLLVSGLVSMIVTLCTNFVTIIQPIIDYLPEIIISLVNALVENLPLLIEGAIQLIVGLVTALPEIILSLVEAMPTVITSLVEGLINAAPLLLDGMKEIWESVKGSAVEIWEGLKGKVVEIAGKVKDEASKKFNELKEKASEKWEAMKTAASEKWESMKSKASSAWESMKSTASSKWESIKSKVTEKAEAIKSKASEKWESIKSKASGVWDSIKSTASEKWESIKSKITSPIETARDTISGIVEKIKGFFTGMKLEFPKIKMPHFGIKPKGWKIGDLLEGSIPKLSIDWYAKAMNNPMIMTRPTIFGYNGATGELMGGGEAGSEVVTGTSTLMRMIQAAVASENSATVYYLQKLIEILADYFPQILEALDFDFGFDADLFVKRHTPAIDKELGKIQERKARGRA